MRRAIALFGLSAVVAAAAASFIVLPNGTSQAAAKEATFVIPTRDGYGVGDCLASGDSECGRIVATAWCEAQGFARFESFGPAKPEDLTASIQPASVSEAAERPLVITCAD